VVRLVHWLLVLTLCVGAASAGRAQDAVESPVLVIDFERAFAESAFGRRLNEEVEREGNAIVAENRRIEAELTAEELRLTEQRATMAPEQFRALADAFDQKVQRLRAEQDAKAEALGSRGEESRIEFLQAARPVLEGLMRETGAAVILERRSVLVAVDSVDITDRAIARIDAQVDPEPAETPEAPDQSQPQSPAPQDDAVPSDGTAPAQP
jgi:Skp family chaperone for outer membrane proteins